MAQRKPDELSILREKAAAKLTKELEDLQKLSVEELKSRYFEIPDTREGLKDLENKVKNKIEELQTIFDSSHNSIWYKDTKNHFIRVNQAAAKIAGLEIDEIEGRSADEIFPLESEKYYKDDLEVIKTGNPKIGIIESVTTKGTTKWVRTDKIPWYTTFGEIAGIIAFTRDVTEQKIAEQNLKESEELLRTVISNAPISIFATDEKGIFTLHEGKAIERVGMKAGENVDVSAYDLFSGLKVIEHNGTVSTGKSILDRVSKGEYLSGITELNGVIFDNQFAPIWDENKKVVGLLGVATDITERKQVEEKLQHSEHNLAAAERIGNTGSWDYDVATDTASWSENMFRIFDVDPAMPKELVFKHFVENLVHPDDRSHILSVFQDALAGKSPYDLEYRIIKRDGSIRTIHSLAETVFDENGKAIRMIGKVEDITKRKQSEEALFASEMQLRFITDNAPICIAHCDLEKRYKFVNRPYAELFGLLPSDIIGKHAREILSKESYAHASPYMDIVLSGQTTGYDLELPNPPKEPRILSIHAVPEYDSDGKVVGFISVFTDITERKITEVALRKSESNLNEAQHLAKIGSWEWDAVTDTINWSKEYYRIYGLDPQKSPPGYEEHLKVYTPESMEVLDNAVKNSMQTGASYDLDLELASITESTRWIRARGECKFDIDGKIIGLRGTAQDITEHKKQEELLRYRAEIAANLSDGVSLIREKDGIIVHTSRRYEEMFGYGHGELIGKHVSILNAPTSNRNAMETAITIIKSVHESGKWKGVVYNVKKDGSFFWSQSSVTQFEHSVFGTVLITIQMDITEQVQAEMALLENEIRQRAMIANISDVIAIVDRNGINRFKSPNVEKWFGWKAEDLIGKKTFDNIHSEDRDRIKNDFYSLLAKPGKDITAECRYLCKNNSYKWIALKAVNQIDNPAISGVLVNYHDISERKKAKEKLIRHENELKLLSSELISTQEKEKKALSIELHDEVGQSLMAMKIDIASIKKEIPPEINTKAFNRIDELDTILDSVINQVHEISLNLRPAMLDVLGLLPTIKSYGNQFSERTGIIVHIGNDININLEKEQEIHLYRIVQEAFTNVVKHAHAKNIFIHLGIKGNILILSIQDDGYGFILNKKESIPPVGIGLIGMRERVNSLKGKMEISTSPQKGTKIEIQIPVNWKHE
ncbi:MAG: PAS domain S-box protein [Lentimicrobiaceae bacterium]|jgi:PAS domain S-box-containing protein